jgi:hypothetical protein
VLGITLALLIAGIRDWLFYFISSWFDNGAKFTILLIICVALVFTPSIVKSHAPDYYGLSILILILYIATLFIVWNVRRTKGKVED